MRRRAIQKLITLVSFFAASACLNYLPAQNLDFNANGFYSFENEKNSSTEHQKFGNASLKWNWKRENSSLAFDVPVPYLSKNPNPKETSISTFSFWVYSPRKLDGALEFAFYKGDEKCCWFDYKLGFTGWRGAWVAFDRDMQGKPQEGMDKIVVTAKEAKKGTLYFDGMIPSAFQDSRQHTADFQAPYINPSTTSHWLLRYKEWNNKMDMEVPENISESQIADMDTIRQRYISLVSKGMKPWSIEKIRQVHDSYGIHRNSDGTIDGKPIFFVRYGETFTNLGISDAQKQLKKSGELVEEYNDALLKIAISYTKEADVEAKQEIARIYVDMTKHLLDQGFAAGSAMGTLHHLGYSMRDFYTVPVLMQPVLEDAGLANEVQQAMEWFSGAGEVKVAPKVPGMDIDAFNTYLLSRMASLIMLKDSPYKYTYFQGLKRWIDNGLEYASGLKPCFKTDGTIFHHRRAYPAYAVGGLDGAVSAVWILRGTSLHISEKSHGNLRQGLLEMKFYCNKESFPLAMSGRHPTGKWKLNSKQYSLLAEAGLPGHPETYDSALVSEAPPQGVKAYGYNSSLSARKDNWLVTIAGHSRYLWSAEIYVGANYYGRYLTHGSMQIMGDSTAEGGDGKTVSAFGSGYRQEGFDWCHIPGTTAAEIPMEKMKANVLNVDTASGYEEMLLSDEWFAGGVSHNIMPGTDKGNSGAYAMILHEHDKYNGSLRAHKSFFVFGNRIVCLGSDLQNKLENSHLHTTLFQNSVDEAHPTIMDGTEFSSMDTVVSKKGSLIVIEDRFHNTWLARDASVVMTRGLQHSYDQSTCEPTEGMFEKAYIDNDDKHSYEYLTVIHASSKEINEYSKEKPYAVLSCNDSLHAMKDLKSGTVAAAVFKPARIDDNVILASESMLMYDINDGVMTLSVSNPDLALYSGPSDDIYKDGKRVERSVYGRSWVDNDCQETKVTVELKGTWNIQGAPKHKVETEHANGNTRLTFTTGEARTEEIRLTKDIY